MKRCVAGLAMMALSLPCLALPYSVEVTPTADAFVRSLEADSNYGKAGGLSVSGAAALNAVGDPMGTLDSFLRFDTAGLVAEMDSHSGGQPWVVQDVVLHVTEQGAPNNPIFNRGTGAFEVLWLASDDWAEGTGSPRDPTSDGVTFADEVLLLDPLADVSLGAFSNTGVDGDVALELFLAGALVDDILAAGEVSLFLTAVDESVGFTFNARDVAPARLPPRLEITADAIDVIPEPASLTLLTLGLCVLARRDRTRRRGGR